MNYIILILASCVCAGYTLPFRESTPMPTLGINSAGKKPIILKGNPYRFITQNQMIKHKVKRVSGVFPQEIPILPSAVLANASATVSIISNQTKIENRFKLNKNLSQGLDKVNSSNSNKNWLLTKAWLIDNINRLKHELNELERDYSQHLTTIERANSQREKHLVEDVRKLRADHTILSQQLKQIIYLFRKSSLAGKKRIISENDINYKSLTYEAQQSLRKQSIKRHSKRDLTKADHQQSYPIVNEDFQGETRRNMREVFTELSSLHDVTLSLFDYFRKLEDRIDARDKLFK